MSRGNTSRFSAHYLIICSYLLTALLLVLTIWTQLLAGRASYTLDRLTPIFVALLILSSMCVVLNIVVAILTKTLVMKTLHAALVFISAGAGLLSYLGLWFTS